jgi:hypothetical protein
MRGCWVPLASCVVVAQRNTMKKLALVIGVISVLLGGAGSPRGARQRCYALPRFARPHARCDSGHCRYRRTQSPERTLRANVSYGVASAFQPDAGFVAIGPGCSGVRRHAIPGQPLLLQDGDALAWHLAIADQESRARQGRQSRADKPGRLVLHTHGPARAGKGLVGAIAVMHAGSLASSCRHRWAASGASVGFLPLAVGAVYCARPT